MQALNVVHLHLGQCTIVRSYFTTNDPFSAYYYVLTTTYLKFDSVLLIIRGGIISVLFISSYAIYVCEMLYICTYTTTFFNKRSRWMRQKWGRLRAFDSKVACRKLLGLRLPCRKVRGKLCIWYQNPNAEQSSNNLIEK